MSARLTCRIAIVFGGIPLAFGCGTKATGAAQRLDAGEGGDGAGAANSNRDGTAADATRNLAGDEAGNASADATGNPGDETRPAGDVASGEGDALDDAALGSDATTACSLDDGASGAMCHGVCVDTQSDPMNCGGCGAVNVASCEAGAICAAGVCQDVIGSLQGLRWSIPCVDAPVGIVCSAVNPALQKTTVRGIPATTYNVTLRFRGVVEQKSYDGVPDGGIAAIGTNASFFITGGTPSPSDAANVYTLEIMPPNGAAFKAYLNAGNSFVQSCWPLDYTVALQVQSGALVTLTADAIDGKQLINQDANGMPIVVPDIPPAPSAYNGQFVQMDVVSVTPAQ